MSMGKSDTIMEWCSIQKD